MKEQSPDGWGDPGREADKQTYLVNLAPRTHHLQILNGKRFGRHAPSVHLYFKALLLFMFSRDISKDQPLSFFSSICCCNTLPQCRRRCAGTVSSSTALLSCRSKSTFGHRLVHSSLRLVHRAARHSTSSPWRCSTSPGLGVQNRSQDLCHSRCSSSHQRSRTRGTPVSNCRPCWLGSLPCSMSPLQKARTHPRHSTLQCQASSDTRTQNRFHHCCKRSFHCSTAPSRCCTCCRHSRGAGCRSWVRIHSRSNVRTQGRRFCLHRSSGCGCRREAHPWHSSAGLGLLLSRICQHSRCLPSVQRCLNQRNTAHPRRSTRSAPLGRCC